MPADDDYMTPPAGPFAFIQWKGTDACVDLTCACGAAGHLDGDFLYFVRCRACGAVYALRPYVDLVPVPPDDATDPHDFGPDDAG